MPLVWLMLTCSCAMVGTPSIAWREDDIVGREFDIADERSAESYTFSPDGLVLATLGEVGGAVADPIRYWKIINGRLVIAEDREGKQEVRRLTLIERRASEVVVRTKWGRRLIFRIRTFGEPTHMPESSPGQSSGRSS